MFNKLIAFLLPIVCQFVITQGKSVVGNVTIANSTQGNITCGKATIENATLGKPLLKSTPYNLPDGYKAFPPIGVAYKYFEHKRPWNAARKECIEEGAHLAVIDSFKKIEYIMGIKKADTIVHAGIHRLYDVVEWTSVGTELPITVETWALNANLATAAGPCTYMFADGNGIHPGVCNSQYNFVCEITLPVH